MVKNSMPMMASKSTATRQISVRSWAVQNGANRNPSATTEPTSVPARVVKIATPKERATGMRPLKAMSVETSMRSISRQ